MSFKEDPILDSYASTLACYEQLQSVFHQDTVVDYNIVLQHLESCLVKVEYLSSIEKEDTEFFIPLLHLKQQVLNMIHTMEEKLKNSTLFWNHDITICRVNEVKRPHENVTDDEPFENKKRADGKINNSDKKILNTIKSIEEIPLVSGLHDIAGLWEVKKILTATVLLPQKQPQLFTNGQLCNTLLLYGPPGTGKTRIVHALAAEAKAKLYSMSAGNILSSYVGQTEEAIQGVFKYIRNSCDVSILFIDEVDGFCRKRTGSEYEYSRRIKTEFMCQLSQAESCPHMYIICATNCPWDLDTAILRRFLRSVYVPLPNHSERLEFLRMFLKNTPFEDDDDSFTTIVDQTEGYSGADLSVIVKHALNIPLIDLQETLIWKCCSDGFFEPICKAEDFEKIICCKINELPPNSVRARQLDITDLLSAVNNVTSTVSKEDILKFEKFSVSNKDNK